MFIKLKNFWAWPVEKKLQSRIIRSGLLCAVIVYGYRAFEVEILRPGLIAALFLLVCFSFALIGLIYWFVLLIHGIRAIISKAPNGLLLSVVLIGPLLAWVIPRPPLREEVKLFLNRSRYEYVVESNRQIYIAHEDACIELKPEDKDLAFGCVLFRDNYASFKVYRGVFSLVYSFDKQTPQAVQCDWNGYVWKRLDENWFICKEDVN